MVWWLTDLEALEALDFFFGDDPIPCSASAPLWFSRGSFYLKNSATHQQSNNVLIDTHHVKPIETSTESPPAMFPVLLCEVSQPGPRHN